MTIISNYMEKSIYKSPEFIVMVSDCRQLICTSLELSVENYEEEKIDW